MVRFLAVPDYPEDHIWSIAGKEYSLKQLSSNLSTCRREGELDRSHQQLGLDSSPVLTVDSARDHLVTGPLCIKSNVAFDNTVNKALQLVGTFVGNNHLVMSF